MSNFVESVGFMTLADTFVTYSYAFASPGDEDCRVEVDTVPMGSLRDYEVSEAEPFGRGPHEDLG